MASIRFRGSKWQARIRCKGDRDCLVDAKQANIEDYVIQKTLDGLFLMIAEQKKTIRKDPFGVATGMAQKVFGLFGK